MTKVAPLYVGCTYMSPRRWFWRCRPCEDKPALPNSTAFRWAVAPYYGTQAEAIEAALQHCNEVK